MKRVFVIILFCLVLILSACCGSSTQVLNSPKEGQPIYTSYFEWGWRWEEAKYKYEISAFLKRDDVRILSICTHEKQTTILYQLRD